MPPTPRPRARRGLLTVPAAAALVLTLVGPAGEPTAAEPPKAPAAAGCPTTGTDGFCDDFESQTGTRPSGRWTAGAPNCSGTGTASVDSSVAHSGGKSLRIDGGGGYCNHVFAGTPLTGVNTSAPFWTRFYVRHTTPLPAAHVTFAALRDSADNNKDLRMGGQNGALQWNRESDDATLPEQSPNGVSMSRPLPVGAWTCVEFRIDGPSGRLETWVNGASVQGLAVDGTPTHDIDGQWLRRAGWRPSPTDLRLGWESYGGETDTLWFDDVAVSGSRVGC
ncbi:hydrolase [Streptomyces macrosporus]|uniref:Cip1-like core domain-containing protein n=1 Tax=Streptomyces macrosporus TaxID=44032 RepID=A0ABN3K2E0_9ACTN